MRRGVGYVFIGLFLSLAARVAEAKTICVNAAATGANNGGCWVDAYTSLQSALATAVSGDEIWVESGTYRPTATSDRTVSFALKNGVGVYAGFAGSETLRSQRDPAAHVTILSGDIGTVGNASDNSYHVLTSDSTVTATGILDGFTITGGNANGAGANQDRGGGMWINGGSPTISHCVFNANGASEKGGGLRVTSASPVIDACVFTSNSGDAGGGGIGAGSGSSFTVKNTVFRGNSTVSTGGAGLEAASGVTVVNSVFQNNSGNGLLFIVGGTVINSTFTGNSSYGVAFDQDGTVANSILWADAIDEVFVGFGTISVTYSDVGGSGFFGTGNKSVNPLFVNAAGGDLRLGPSPAVNAGNNAAVPPGVTMDIAGRPRFFEDPSVPDTGAGTPPIVDMGANERVPLSVTAPTPSPQTICAGASASFSVTANGQGPLSYRWRKGVSDLFDGGSISGSTTVTLTINPAATGDTGGYNVVVTDTFGQTVTSSSGTLTVNAIPAAPVAGNNGPICGGQDLHLTATTVAGASYAWSGPLGFTSGQQSPTIFSAPSSASGIYSVTATVNGCPSPPAATTATVRPLPSAAISAPTSVCAGSGGHAASVPDAGPGATYSWTIGNGTITAGAGTRSIVFSAGASGSVSLSVSVTDANGCAANGSVGVPIAAACLSFFTLTPCRVLDTRGPAGPYGAPALAAGAERTFVFEGQCGIPPTAKAVSVNIAVTQPSTGPGFLTLYPGGTSRPLAATINYNTGQTRANNAIIPLGTAGDISVHCGQGSGTVQLIVDVNGYFE